MVPTNIHQLMMPNSTCLKPMHFDLVDNHSDFSTANAEIVRPEPPNKASPKTCKRAPFRKTVHGEIIREKSPAVVECESLSPILSSLVLPKIPLMGSGLPLDTSIVLPLDTTSGNGENICPLLVQSVDSCKSIILGLVDVGTVSGHTRDHCGGIVWRV